MNGRIGETKSCLVEKGKSRKERERERERERESFKRLSVCLGVDEK